MAAIMALASNWRPSVTSPGSVVQVPANYGTGGRLSFWHWLRNTQIPDAPPNAAPLYNALAPTIWHARVNAVPVTIMTPVQVTPEMRFTPAGTARSQPGEVAPNALAQVWTGAV